MTIEQKKQKCRNILETAMEGMTAKRGNPSWFDWDKFNADMTAALEELEEASK